MKKIRAFAPAAVVGVALVVGQAFARPPVYFKAPKMLGTGCPKNTTSVTGVNTANLSIKFDRYDAASPSGDAVSKLKRSACSFALPVHVPKGFQVSYMASDWKGSSEGKTLLRREYFFAGQRYGAVLKDTPEEGDFTIRDDFEHGALNWSKCGKDVRMRINSSVRARKKTSYIAMKKMTFHLKWRKCR